MSSNEDEDDKKLETVPFDPRFPNANQSLACFVNYVDYHRCVQLLDGDTRCEYLKKMFTTMCPNCWVEKWDDMRNAGTFPHPITKVPKDYCEKLKEAKYKKK